MTTLTRAWRVVATMALLLTFLVLRARPAVAAPASAAPANDDFNNATVISATPFTTSEDTTGATSAADDPTSCGTPNVSVWFAFTPSVSGTVIADPSGSTYFPVVSAFTGSRGALSPVACGEVFVATHWAVTAGVTYDIMVSGLFGSGGTLSLQVTEDLPPGNDDFDNATAITSLPFTATVDTTAATSAPDDPTTCFGTANSVWFSITPSVDETIFLSAGAETFSPAESAYSGARGSLTQVACAGFAQPGSWLAMAGVTYHIMVVDTGGPAVGAITLQVSAALPPANDDFDNATPITSLPFTSTENAAGATTAADDPTACDGASNSVWYSFTPTIAETISASAGGIFSAPFVSVYTGSRGSLNQIACGSRVQWTAVVGVTYHLMVVTEPGAFGTNPDDQQTIIVTGNVAPVNDDFDHATVVTSLPYTGSINAAGATAAPDDPTSCGSTAESVWYRLTPSASEVIVADTSGSAYVPSISVYTGSEGSLTEVACVGASFQVTAGVTYYLMVANAEPSLSAGQLDLNLQGFLPPPNDAINHATVITTLPYANSIDTTGATSVPSDPTCFLPPAATVWYRFIAPVSGTIEATTAGSGYVTTVSAYTGSSGALTAVTCGFNDTSPFAVVKGATYYFEVSSVFSTLGGSLDFAVTGVSDGPGPCTTTSTGILSRGVTVSSGTTCMTNATVRGPVTVDPGAQLVLSNTTVEGPVTSNGATAVEICGSSITGALLVSRSTGFVLIGNGAAGGGCAGNTVNGNILIGGSPATANTSGINLGGNTITGQVIVTGNKVNPASVLVPTDATVDIDANHVRGDLSCTGNSPSPVNNGLLNNVSGVRTGQCAAL